MRMMLVLALLALSLFTACSRSNPLVDEHNACWNKCETTCGGNEDCIRYCRARRCNSS